MAQKPDPNFKVVSDNRKARYQLRDRRDLRGGPGADGNRGQIAAHRQGDDRRELRPCRPQGRGWLVNATIPEYMAGNRFNHEPKRLRKLLLKQRELVKLSQAVEREGMSIVPLRLYFNARGRAKIQIALGRGKKLHDKREVEKKRDWNREKGRLMRDKG